VVRIRGRVAAEDGIDRPLSTAMGQVPKIDDVGKVCLALDQNARDAAQAVLGTPQPSSAGRMAAEAPQGPVAQVLESKAGTGPAALPGTTPRTQALSHPFYSVLQFVACVLGVGPGASHRGFGRPLEESMRAEPAPWRDGRTSRLRWVAAPMTTG
jgi:hypothetical protein